MNQENEKISPLFYVIMLALTVPLYLMSGWILSVLWGWYVVPLGLQSLTVVHGAGIVLIVNFLTMKFRGDEKGDLKTTLTALISGVLYDLMCLFMGYILLLMM